MSVLDGRVALVTGGGDGIGRAVVDRYVHEGVRVGVLERRSELVAELAAAYPGKVVALTGDVRDPEAHRAITERVVHTFGGLDIYVGNAGIYDYGKRLAQWDPNQLTAGFDELFQINVLGNLMGIRAAQEELEKSRGCVILTGSSSGSYAGGGGALYVASKHAVVGLTRQLAFEFAPRIRVNCVAPGATSTGLQGISAVGQDQQLRDQHRLMDGLAKTIPLGFVSRPEHHVGLYVLLADPEQSGFITGAVLPSDGGVEVRGRGPESRWP